VARIRTVKPAFFRHRGLYLLEQSSGFPIRVAFEGLWTVADREGRFRWKPEELKLDCLPYDALDFSDVLNALERGDFVRRYEVDAKAYGWIPSFLEHQVINQREAASTLPEPPTSADTCTHIPAHGEGKGREKEGKGTEESVEDGLFSEPVLLEFPTVGPGGSAWRLRRVQVDEWQTAFPNLDVLAECRKALVWVAANPGRRKTGRGMPKFLVGWCSRAVDSGRVNSAVGKPAVTASDVDWFEECKRLHGGACEGDRMRHHLRVQTEKTRAS
jgi:hypothetical protein